MIEKDLFASGMYPRRRNKNENLFNWVLEKEERKGALQDRFINSELERLMKAPLENTSYNTDSGLEHKEFFNMPPYHPIRKLTAIHWMVHEKLSDILINQASQLYH